MKLNEHFSKIFSVGRLDEVCQKYIKWQKRTGRLFGFNIQGTYKDGIQCLYMDNIISVPDTLAGFIFYFGDKKILVTPKNLEFYDLIEFKSCIYPKSDCVLVRNNLGEKVYYPKTCLNNIKKNINLTEDREKHIVVVSEGLSLLTSIDNTVLTKTPKGNKYMLKKDAICFKGNFYSKEFLSKSYKFKYNSETGEISEIPKKTAQKIRAGMEIHRRFSGRTCTERLFDKKEVCLPHNFSKDGVFFGVEIEKMKEPMFNWQDKYIMLADGFILHYDASVSFEISTPIFTIDDSRFWKILSNIYNNYDLSNKTANPKCGGHINISVTEKDNFLLCEEVFSRIKPIAHLIYGTNNERTMNKHCKVKNMSVELATEKYSSFFKKGIHLLEIRVFGEHLTVEQIKSRTTLLDLAIKKKYADEVAFYEDVVKNKKVKEIFANFLANEKQSLYEIMYWLSVTIQHQKEKIKLLKKIQSIIENIYCNN